jgi:aspartate kinase
MKVFKFGGASVDSIDRVRKIGDILHLFPNEKILIVISAMGKTTNALEKVVEAFYNGNKEEALILFENIKQHHLTSAKYLLVTHYNDTYRQLKDFFTEAEWLLHDNPVREFDYYYDQLVCIGELLSTTIVSAYLNEIGLNNKWVDVRDIFRTDDNFRDANIDWDFTQQKINEDIVPLLNSTSLVMTQGFIGSTDENESTTLGREGSDYSAAIFANMLDAEKLIIWKDVEGVMNADPKQYPDAILIKNLNYTEVIEMAYYGAQVLHPKTIKPIQNKQIPLYVKCFLHPEYPGTLIKLQSLTDLPPIIVLKENQVMMQMKSKDFSFVGEHAVGQLFHLFEALNIRPNLTQNGAITFMCVVDDRTEKIEKLALEASKIFEVQIMKGLNLLSIRHFNNELYEKLTAGRNILLKQENPDTIQVLMTA